MLLIQWDQYQSQLQSLPPLYRYIPKEVNKEHWRFALRFLPSSELTKLEQFLAEYEEGMNFGLGDRSPKPVQSRSNPPMDLESRIKMSTTILKWYKKGYLLGPFKVGDPLISDLRLNPVFCVPKPDGSVRPVVNYSKSINGSSLNELLDPRLCTVEYLKMCRHLYVGQRS